MNNLEETFRYDNLNRLTEIRLGEVNTVTYTGFDKVLKMKQGGDSLCYS